MKKSILLLFTLTFSLAFANAQTLMMPYGRADISNRILLNDETISVRNTLKSDSRFAYSFGVDVIHNFTPKWRLKTGLMFQKMGNQLAPFSFYLTEEGKEVDIYTVFDLHFYNLPIQIQYNINPEKRFSPYVAIGGMINRKVINIYYDYHYFYIKDGQEIPVALPQYDILYWVNRYNLSPKVDIGFDYRISPQLFLNTFVSGNLLLRSMGQVYGNTRYYNIGIGLGLGYTI